MNLEDYNHAEAQLHVASQMISLTGKNLVQKKPDDSHTTARWDPGSQLIIGREFRLHDSNYAVFVNPVEFAIGMMKDGQHAEKLSLDGLSYIDTVAPWKAWLEEAGFEGDLNLKLHYELPQNDIYKFDAFTKPSDEILKGWASNRSLANKILSNLTQLMATPSDINIWPHHFDSGTYYELHQTDGITDRSIGAGFNPTDSMVDEPYFYIYGWYKGLDIDYTDKPELNHGKWILGNWKGAVLPLSQVNESSANQLYRVTSHYLKNKLT